VDQAGTNTGVSQEDCHPRGGDLEKPDEATAHEAMATDSLWNSMVLVSREKQTLELRGKCFPEMMSNEEYFILSSRIFHVEKL
jgi:mannose-1-phosphate guanylyltransferase